MPYWGTFPIIERGAPPRVSISKHMMKPKGSGVPFPVMSYRRRTPSEHHLPLQKGWPRTDTKSGMYNGFGGSACESCEGAVLWGGQTPKVENVQWFWWVCHQLPSRNLNTILDWKKSIIPKLYFQYLIEFGFRGGGAGCAPPKSHCTFLAFGV